MLNDLIFLAVVVLALFYNFAVWHSDFFGFVFLFIYLFFIGNAWHRVLNKFFNLSSAFRIKVLSFFLGLSVLGWITGWVSMFARLTVLNLVYCIIVTGIVSVLLKNWAKLSHHQEFAEEPKELAVLEELPHPVFTFLAYIILLVFGFYFLYFKIYSGSYSSPWQMIDSRYIYIFFFSVTILGFLIFSQLKTKIILFLLVIQTFLMVSYLPATHELFFGADGWRHLAMESRLIAEQDLTPVNLSGQPQTFFQSMDFGRLAYAQFWSLAVIFEKVCNLSLISFNKWFLPIVWSLVFPILLYEFGRVFGRSKKESLFLAWLGLLPFAWQVGGAFTLPVNFSFLTWLILILLILKGDRQKKKQQLITVSLLIFLSFAGYSLYIILLALGILVWQLLAIRVNSSWLKNTLSIILIFLVTLTLPVFELITGYSFLNQQIFWWTQIKQLVGNFSAWYLASGPRPHDIATGNFLFNQIPSYSFVVNFLTEWRYWIVALALVLWAGFFYGCYKCLMGDRLKKWLAIMSLGVLGSYIVSRYFLVGENLLTRRLDIVLAFGFILTVFIPLSDLIKKCMDSTRGRIWLVLIIIIFAAGITASYSLGPDTKVVSLDEYKAMDYIWQADHKLTKCVLADTYPLLALEAISGKQIVGGGFPIDQYFGQPERVRLYNMLTVNYDSEAINIARQELEVDHCWVVGSEKLITLVLGKPQKIFGNIGIYNINK